MINLKDKQRDSLINGPLLDSMKVAFSEKVNFNNHPFSLPIIKNLSPVSSIKFFKNSLLNKLLS